MAKTQLNKTLSSLKNYIYPNRLYRIITRTTQAHLTQKVLKLGTAKEKFSLIYEGNIWGSDESGSGPGSEFLFTENLRAEIPQLCKEFEINTIVDAPCGDFNWMQHILPEINARYHGLDIVDSVITQNKRLHEKGPVTFGVADICSDPLPSCDLLIVRDCLFHFSNKDIDRFFENIERLDFKYLLTTTHVTEDDYRNHDIVTGSYRPIDLTKEPFNIKPKEILRSIDDFPNDYPVARNMILLEKSSIPKHTSIEPTS